MSQPHIIRVSTGVTFGRGDRGSAVTNQFSTKSYRKFILFSHISENLRNLRNLRSTRQFGGFTGAQEHLISNWRGVAQGSLQGQTLRAPRPITIIATTSYYYYHYYNLLLLFTVTIITITITLTTFPRALLLRGHFCASLKYHYIRYYAITY